jgi:hypothetical protein
MRFFLLQILHMVPNARLLDSDHAVDAAHSMSALCYLALLGSIRVCPCKQSFEKCFLRLYAWTRILAFLHLALFQALATIGRQSGTGAQAALTMGRMHPGIGSAICT